MKLSVSLSEQDIAALDAYVEKAGLQSRSAGLQRAVQMLRHPDLEDDYAEAWAHWSADEGWAAWESTVEDGVVDAAR
ncbi:Arc/MetJ-type ribon-helix-helix transcriptional regulator [Mycolicibacterium sp. BK634]|uniref:ribbon-helix-helix domain-containing protein n=1 Tax=Mycolicibacterium sp. BK634 TaxID=2587099 RepID=UPI0016205A82|nr:ribbon-helix-helix domain-containing protein [Mycolicibacterium sp. BK634]MBB3753762.1 Arc/MetJ-type ribon-helix-helix transcriptional regulator [Mycolicibacterium sp. BK634]